MAALIDGRHLYVYGVAIEYGTVSNPIPDEDGYYLERILPGAVRSLTAPEISACDRHREDRTFARVGDGTLAFRDSHVGLSYVFALPRDFHARGLADDLRQGVVRGSSIGFTCTEDRWHRTERGTRVRTIRGLALHHVSTVSWSQMPSYPSSTALLGADIEAQN